MVCKCSGCLLFSPWSSPPLHRSPCLLTSIFLLQFLINCLRVSISDRSRGHSSHPLLLGSPQPGAVFPAAVACISAGNGCRNLAEPKGAGETLSAQDECPQRRGGCPSHEARVSKGPLQPWWTLLCQAELAEHPPSESRQQREARDVCARRAGATT